MQRIGEILQNFPTGTPSHPQTPVLMPLLPPLSEMAKSLNVNIDHTFTSIKEVPGITPVVRAIQETIAGPRFMALIYGGVGNGKTHLMEAASIELYKRGRVARVVTFSKILSVLKSAIANPEKDYEQILSNYCSTPQAIIDDIGAGGSDTDFGAKILETIVCARYGRELLTIMSTNKDIENIPERVLSRLKDKSTSFLIFNKAEDYRPKLV